MGGLPMESFFRYISYVDYYKNNERIKNVGFFRWKLYNGEHHIEMQLKDVSCPKENYVIKEKRTGKKFGEITIEKGIGVFTKIYPSMIASEEMYVSIFGERLYLSDVEGFVITLSGTEYLEVLVKPEIKSRIERKEYKIEENDYEERKDKVNIGKGTETKAASENILIEGLEEKYMEPLYERKIEESTWLKSEDRMEAEEDSKTISYVTIQKKEIENEKIKIIEPVHEDKWKQLCRQYPTVHPFPNQKMFISIKPEDFIILQKEYQKLVHNSFLLHGFYNYGHMILGKLTEEKEAPVYIGVPGVYYEQEKRAARMFGFIGFEGVEHPVQTGSYGYYMVEVEI